jgi:hypothetical protein
LNRKPDEVESFSIDVSNSVLLISIITSSSDLLISSDLSIEPCPFDPIEKRNKQTDKVILSFLELLINFIKFIIISVRRI